MRTITKAVLRILIVFMGLQYLVDLFNSLFWAFNNIKSYEEANLFWYAIGDTIFVIILAGLLLFILWWKTDWLTTRMVPETNDNEIKFTINSVELIIMVVRILGIYLFVVSLPALIGLIGQRLMAPGVVQYLFSDVRRWIENIAFVLLGLVLIFLGKNIVLALDKIWNPQHLSKVDDV